MLMEKYHYLYSKGEMVEVGENLPRLLVEEDRQDFKTVYKRLYYKIIQIQPNQ